MRATPVGCTVRRRCHLGRQALKYSVAGLSAGAHNHSVQDGPVILLQRSRTAGWHHLPWLDDEHAALMHSRMHLLPRLDDQQAG